MDLVKNGIFVAIVAHGLIGISLVWDKILLRKPGTRNVVSYVFWMSAMNVFGCALAVLGFHLPAWRITLLALGAGALEVIAIYYYYAALKAGEATEALALMGGFSPLATALIAIPILGKLMGPGSLPGFIVMTIGGFVMFFTERLDLRRSLGKIVAASVLFGLVNVLQKVVFNHVDFVTGYVLLTLGTFAGALALLARRSWRKQIFASSEETTPRSRFWYFVNRFLAGVGAFLTYYAISLANPAVVDAISAERYAIIFVAVYLLTRWRPDLLKEDFHGWVLAGKVTGTVLIASGLAILGWKGEGAETMAAIPAAISARREGRRRWPPATRRPSVST